MVRIASLRRGLADHFDVTYVAPAGPADPTDVQRAVSVRIAKRPGSRLRALLSSEAYHAHLWADPAMNQAVRAELARQRFDFVYCHLIYSVDYLPPDSRTPIVIDQQNVDSDYWLSRALRGGSTAVLAWRNRRRVLALEARSYERAALVVTVSPQDRAQMTAFGVPDSKLVVAPNGASFGPVSRRRPAQDETVLGFLASFDMTFNQSAAEELVDRIAPAVRAALPGRRIRVLLIGRGSDTWLRRRPRMDVMATGEVEETRTFLDEVDIFVAPLSDGAGTKLKVIEALAAGLPVLGSELALRGLGGRSGTHFIQSRQGAYVQDIINLISDPSLADRIANQGHAFASAHFDWSSVIVPRLAAELRRRFAPTVTEPSMS
jgi:polysaccharide biosynthesis protein PslH